MIDHIRDMILGSFAENIDVDLAALIWSVDAKEHCIPRALEINSALQQIAKYSVVRSETGIKITNTNSQNPELISEFDIKNAMEKYNSTFGLV
jgi:hypothetical protein